MTFTPRYFVLVPDKRGVTCTLNVIYWSTPRESRGRSQASAGADERRKVERLCRYIARPAIAEGRLSLTAQGQVRNTL